MTLDSPLKTYIEGLIAAMVEGKKVGCGLWKGVGCGAGWGWGWGWTYKHVIL